MNDLQRRVAAVRVICFDIDGTLIEHRNERTVWQLFNRHFHGDDEINRARFRAFRNGRLEYHEWVALDILDWKAHGARREQLEQLIRENLKPVAGVERTVEQLKRRGYRVAVISGTLDLTVRLLLDGIGFDETFTNSIEFDAEGCISGWLATPYDVDGKATAIDELADRFECRVEECAFIGDSWNDLPAFARAGVAVGFRPKSDEVRQAVDIELEGPLESLLELFTRAPDAR